MTRRGVRPNPRKLAVAGALIAALAFGLTETGRPSLAVAQPSFLHAYRQRAAIPVQGRHVLAIVYMTPQGLPPNTMSELRALHASGVLLYAAWYSDAYFPVRANPYGMASPANSLWRAVERLHRHHEFVVGVISSALFDTRQAPPAQARLVQDPVTPTQYGIFDPITAARFVRGLTSDIVRFAPIDGLYVGEPYFIRSSQDAGSRSTAFPTLYRSLMAITGPARVPQVMIMPYSLHQYQSGGAMDPIHTALARLPFRIVGVDAEYADASNSASFDLGYLGAMARAATTLAAARPSAVELSLKNATQTAYVSPALFARETRLLRQSGTSDIVVFAAEFLDGAKPAERAAYSRALAAFLAPGAQPAHSTRTASLRP